MTDDDKELSKAFRLLAGALLEMGRVDEAKVALEKSAAILSGQPMPEAGRLTPVASNLTHLTPEQLRRRDRAQALTKATTPLHEAAASHPEFGSLNKWADHHGFPRSSLHAAATGPGYARPEWDIQARRDFPTLFTSGWDWPVGVKARRKYTSRS